MKQFKKRKIIMGDPYLCKEYLKQKRTKKQIKDTIQIASVMIISGIVLEIAFIIGCKLNG